MSLKMKSKTKYKIIHEKKQKQNKAKQSKTKHKLKENGGRSKNIQYRDTGIFEHTSNKTKTNKANFVIKLAIQTPNKQGINHAGAREK